MVVSVKINNEIIYKLSKWDASLFNQDFTLYVQSSDFNKVANDFSQIETLEILVDDTPTSVYRCFDEYGSISFVGKFYVEGERSFADTFAVTLTKANLMEIIDRLDGAVLDGDNMDEFLEIVYDGAEG